MVKKKELRQIDNNDNVLILYGMDNFLEDTDLGHLWG